MKPVLLGCGSTFTAAKPVLLLDMDGPLAEWEEGLNSSLLRLDPSFPVENKSAWKTFSHYSEKYPDRAKFILDAYSQPGFYRHLHVVEGAVEAVRLLSEHFTVVPCSSPTFENPTCESDKKAWLQEHFGDELALRLILTKDKTLVRGFAIIDDHPKMTGLMVPEWEQIVFDKPYNQHLPGRRILFDWSNVRDVFGLAA